MEINVSLEEGFMGFEIPVIKLDDGAVKFWLPRWEWERMATAVREAIAEHPETMEYPYA